MRRKSQNYNTLSTIENFEMLESLTINDGQSMFEIFITVLYVIKGLEKETLKKKKNSISPILEMFL